jgi:Transposase IS66 family
LGANDFEYRDSRKAQFLGPLLEEFKGVLISDFFTGYDSLNCLQQKCLIDLIRDMNEELLGNTNSPGIPAASVALGTPPASRR